MITQKHGRKLASQLGEVLLICQFLRLADSGLKKFFKPKECIVAHSVCVCPFSSTKALQRPHEAVRKHID